jgi:ABC-type transport system involved in cytochrome c biogenesis permease component
MNYLCSLIQFEWHATWKQTHLNLHGLLFFMFCIILHELMQTHTIKVFALDTMQWVLLLYLITSLMHCQSMLIRFRQSHTLLHYLLSPHSFKALLLIKLTCHYLQHIILFSLAIALSALLYQWHLHDALGVIINIAVCTPSIYLCACLVFACTAPLHQAATLSLVISLPLYTPVFLMMDRINFHTYNQYPILPDCAGLIGATILMLLLFMPFIESLFQQTYCQST